MPHSWLRGGLFVTLAAACALLSSAAPAHAAAPPDWMPASVSAPASIAAATAKAAAKPANWRPSYPFPQCISTTLKYDVSFVGPVQYTQVGTVRFAYHRFGPLNPAAAKARRFSTKSGPAAAAKASPVIFIPGWGMSMYMWPIPLLTRLAEDREVVVFDQMRSGLSTDTSTAPLTIQLMASNTAGLIRALKLDKPDVWSWSVGGCVAYALLANHHQAIDNVIIASGSPGGPNAYLPPPSVLEGLRAAAGNYTALLPFLFPNGARDDGVCALFAAYNSFYRSKYTALEKPLSATAMLEQSGAVVRFFESPDVINRLSSVPNRVLILHGVQDRIMPIRNAPLADDKLLGAWMLQMPGEGHGVPFSNLQAVIYLTNEFFFFRTILTPSELDTWADYGSTVAERKAQVAKGAIQVPAVAAVVLQPQQPAAVAPVKQRQQEQQPQQTQKVVTLVDDRALKITVSGG